MGRFGLEIRRSRLAVALGFALGTLARAAFADDLGETREIRFTGSEAAELRDKAAELGSATAIYEFVRNGYEFIAYDGARSDSVAVFGHGRGNDVDLASLLIAMLRSQGIPSRYATGKTFFTYGALTSWLQIPNDIAAFLYLMDRGSFDLESFADGVEFSHAWVQALVPLDRYRAAGVAESIDCAVMPGACTWVDLDPAFKLHRFRDPSQLVDVSDEVPFDYQRLYQADDPTPALASDGIERKNKNPLEIYEEQILEHLHSNPQYAGKTLEDTIYAGEIVPDEQGIVPTSPPFRVVPGAVKAFTSVDAHDATAASDPALPRWSKNVWFAVEFTGHPELGALELAITPVALSQLASKELTLAYESADFDDPTKPRNLVARLGDSVHQTLFTYNASNRTYTTITGANGTVAQGNEPGFDTPITITASMEASANSDSENAVDSRAYPNLRLGGFFVIGAGGEHSSWTQVHAAVDSLNGALDEIPLVSDPASGELLIDDGDGLPEPTDVPLVADAEAQRRLTGGVLALAKNLYFARLVESTDRVGALTHSTMGCDSILGVFSAVHDVHAVDGTAFLVTPAGLLIDVRALTFPSYAIDQDEEPDRHAFLLEGHVASSLEHEVWQELTGFEAISTIKGIQRTIRDGDTLIALSSQVPGELDPALTSWSFAAPPFNGQPLPAGFSDSGNDLALFGMNLWFPHRTTGGSTKKVLDVVRPGVDASTPEALRSVWALDVDSQGSWIEAWIRQWEAWRLSLEAAQLSYASIMPGSPVSQTTTGALPGTWTTGNPAVWTLTGTTQRRLYGTLGSSFLYSTDPLVKARGFYTASISCSGGTLFSLVGHVFGFDVNDALVGMNSEQEIASDTTIPCLGGTYSSTAQGAWFDAKANKKPTDLAQLPVSLKMSGTATAATATITQWGIEYAVRNNPPLAQAWQAYPDPACHNSTNAQDLLGNLDDCFFAVIAREENKEIRDYVAFFDKNRGFVSANQWYRAFDRETQRHVRASAIEAIREDLIASRPTSEKIDYLVPNRVARGELLDFEVSLRRKQESGIPGLPADEFKDTSTTYAIALASGGYVSGIDAIDPYNPIETAYNELLFIRDVIVAEVNNAIYALSTLDPIATVTGNMYHDETDLRVKGRGGLDYVFSRTYNSIPSRANATGAPIGRGWTHSYAARLISRDGGVSPSTSAPENHDDLVSSIVYFDERGGEHIYGVSPAWQITNPRGNFDTLDLSGIAQSTYTLRFRNGTRYEFGGADLSKPNRVAPLVRIEDPFGNELTLDYDAKGRLETVRDDLGILGRTGLAFAYFPSDRLQSVSDWSGRPPWQFGYDALGNLTSVTNPKGEVTRYEYEPGAVLKFRPAPGPAVTQNGVNPAALAAADVDGDGDADLVWSVPGSENRIYWSQNLGGTGTFGSRIEVSEKNNPGALRIIDLDGDGNRDVLGDFPGELAWFKNLGGGSFNSNDAKNVGFDGDPMLLTTADYDADGDPDPFVASDNGKFQYRVNRLNQGTGLGNGSATVVSTNEKDAKALEAFDFNGDGRVDVFIIARSGSSQPYQLAWYESPGETRHLIAQAVSTPTCAALADVTGDGQIDIVTAGIGFVAIHPGTGGASFGAPILPASLQGSVSLSNPASLLVNDLDNDGDADVAYANVGTDQVYWHENTTPPGGTLSFSSARLLAAGDNPFLAQADLDVDGDLDLVAAMRGDQTIVWLENRGVDAPLTRVVLPEDRDQDGQGDVSTTFDYYENGRAFSNANAFGDGERLDYDLYRKRTRITDPRGFVSAQFYDENGELTKLTEPDGAVSTFRHNSDGRRWERTDALGFTTQFSYCASRATNGCVSDSGGNVTLERDPLQKTLEYDYHPSYFDQITRAKDKNGAERLFTYYGPGEEAIGGVEGKLHEVRIAALGGHANVLLQSFTYYGNGNANGAGNLKEQFDFIDPVVPTRKKTTTFFYFPGGVNLQRTEESGLAVSGQPLPVRTRSFTYDALGRLKTETLLRRELPTQTTLIPLTTSYDYDDLGRVTRVVDPLANETHTDYDANGNMKEVRFLAMQTNGTLAAPRLVEKRRYDDADRLVETEDVFGAISHFEYDAGGKLIRAVDPTNASVRLQYDSMGRLVRTIDENGNGSRRAYDLAGRVIAEVDPLGNQTRSGYDALGRRVSVVDPLGHTASFAYDDNGSLVGVVDANANADPGNPALRNTEFGDSLHNEYDELGRLLRTVNARNEQTSFAYDLLGNRTYVIDDEAQITQFLYDDFGRLRRIVDPVHETPDKFDRLIYDEADNVIQTIDREDRTTYNTYDRLNRLVERNFSTEGKIETFTYDPYGNVKTISNDEVTYTFTHDAKHRLKTRTDSRFGRTLAFDYDAADRVTRKTDYQGDVTEYQYDATGRLVAERNAAYLQASYHYDGAGRLLNRILSNGSQSDYSYDAAGRLRSLRQRTADGTPVLEVTYDEYDAVGNVKKTTTNGQVATYGYDAVHRLLGADLPGTANDVTYTYDGVGNRETEVTPAGSRHYVYGAGNRLLEIHTVSETGPLLRSFTYSDAGEVESKKDGSGNVLYTLERSSQGRVVGIASPSVSQTLGYDPMGLRVRRSQSGVSDERFHLEGEHLEAIYDAAGTLEAKFLRGSVIDEVVNGYFYDANGKPTNLTYHHDTLQSVVGLSGHTGSVTETQSYGPFGSSLGSTGGSPSELRYTGRERDPVTGLYYYRARYYDPEIGRFLSEDPTGFEANVNFYAYVNNNPLLANDPTGLIDFLLGTGASAVVPTGGTEASGGLFFGIDNQTGAPRGGPFTSAGAGTGYNISYDVFVGIAEDINGPSINQNFNLGPFGVTTFHDPVSLRVIGGTAGVGEGISQVGYSVTYAITAGLDVVEPIVRAAESIRRAYAKP